ncbi:MAG: transcription antitermination factor NusB [Lachnospiraceae bacterium]|nr:transcription antitermination factor NusB [Lachnospiraceae bacterium]
MTRRDLREHLFRLIFMQDFHPAEEQEDVRSLYYEFADQTEGLTEEELAEISERFAKVEAEIPKLDPQIEEVSIGWKLARMSKVDLAILRLAAFELLCDEKIPTGVAINEAVELAKRYGGDASPSFVNGILAKLATK